MPFVPTFVNFCLLLFTFVKFWYVYTENYTIFLKDVNKFAFGYVL